MCVRGVDRHSAPSVVHLALHRRVRGVDQSGASIVGDCCDHLTRLLGQRADHHRHSGDDADLFMRDGFERIAKETR